MFFDKNNISHSTIILIGILLLFSSANINWGNNRWQHIIKADGKGYYAWLPAIFIYNDVNFGFFDKIEKQKYFKEELFYDYRVNINNKTSNKYFLGTAILQMPFFLTAHLITKLTKNDADGYSKWYAIFINVAAIFYALAALFFSNKLLKNFGIKDINRCITLIIMAFSTNLFYYVVGEPAMSHIYSFFCITSFCYYVSQLKNQKKAIYISAILFGIIVLIRPINAIIILFIPFLFSDFLNFRNTLLSTLKNIILPAFIFFVIVSIQPAFYYFQTGHFLPDTYPDEHFNFLRPQIIMFLFSFKKGLFLYSPIFILSTMGFYFLYFKNKFHFYYLLFYCCFLIYILSSWWNWWYGGSFSSRVILDYQIIFVLLFALCLENLNKKLKPVYISIAVIFLILCQIQTYQYRYYIIHWENMNKELYINSILAIKNFV